MIDFLSLDILKSLSSLTIVGWNGTQWVSLASTVDGTSLLGGTSSLTTGSITTNLALVPDTYTVYTLGVLGTLCSAGTTAPTLSTTTKSNTCPASTVDLSTITASNLPSGTSLTWHSGTPATTANKGVVIPRNYEDDVLLEMNKPNILNIVEPDDINI